MPPLGGAESAHADRMFDWRANTSVTARVASTLARVTWDCLAWLIALVMFTIVRYDFVLSNAQWEWVTKYAVIVISLQLVLGFATQLYLGRSRPGSFGEITWMTGLVAVVGIPLGALLAAFFPTFPRGIGLVVPPLALLLMAAGRWVFRALDVLRPRSDASDTAPVLVYGAGDLGHQVAYLVDVAKTPPYRVIGFIDDDPAKRFLRIRRYRVLGTGARLVDIARSQGATTVILAITQAPPKLFQKISDECEEAGLELIVVPAVREMIGGRVTLKSLREFNVADLLGRRPIKTDVSSIAHYISDKSVLITGAGGSIGSELAHQVHALGPRKLVLLDRDESELHAVQLAIYGNGLLESEDIVLCDIRDFDSLMEMMQLHRPDVVFHAAALKHLPMLQRYPMEGWKTNVLGTLNVLRSSQAVGVSRLVNVSTDKAADPSSVLGRTKRLAERLTAFYAKTHELPYLSVRFGNVLGSRGSVLYSFRAQIDRGGPVTITHPEVTRYFMTIPEACELVLQAGALGDGGEVLVLDMGQPVKILDVARRLIVESGKDIEIQYTGLRPGEKMDEVLLSEREQGRDSGHPLITRVSVPPLDPSSLSPDSDTGVREATGAGSDFVNEMAATSRHGEIGQ